MPEQQNIEYRQSWHNEYLKWVCGFSKNIGGQDGGRYSGQDGGQVEKLIKEFGSIEDRIRLEKNENIQYLRGIYGVFTGYLRDNYGVKSDEVKNKFGERALQILILVVLDNNITKQNIAKILGTSLSTIEKNMKQLGDEKIIERADSDKAGYWQIIKTK